MTKPKVKVLRILECPSWEPTLGLINEIIDEGFDAEPEVILITDSEIALAEGFAGSPTIVFDGVDIFPSTGPTGDLACRIYFTPAGVAGHPTKDQIKTALKERVV